MNRRATGENFGRGALCALIVLPLGTFAFSTFWSAVFVAPLVFLVIAWLAVILYRLGAGAPISRWGVLVVSEIVLLTLALSIFAGLVAEVAASVGAISHLPPLEAMGVPQFWSIFGDVLADSAAQSRFVPTIVVATAFSAIGVVTALRGLFHRQSRLAAHA